MRAAWILVLAGACGFQVTGGVGPSGEDAGNDGAASDPDAGTVIDLDALVPALDAAVDAPPTTTTCGDVGQACCTTSGQPACDDGGECTDGTCTACGAIFQSCCDPGRTCGPLGVCIGETCASL